MMMQENKPPLVSICMPHWQVKELISLSLQAIRINTSRIPIEILVVDNGSKDESLDYLRGLKWIRLIERGEQTPENWVRAFGTALDIGLENSRGDYYIIMHTDTIIKRPDWLERLLEPVQKDPQCAAVGAWKLEKHRPVYDFLKKMTDTKKAKLWLRRTVLGDKNARQKSRTICPRDYCTLYRAEPIRKYGLKFGNPDGPYKGYTAGEQMFYQLRDHGYGAHVLDTLEMMEYMEHVGHATAALRPDQRHLNHWRTQKRVERKLRRFFNDPYIQTLQKIAKINP